MMHRFVLELHERENKEIANGLQWTGGRYSCQNHNPFIGENE
jgi:hypothetical protein